MIVSGRADGKAGLDDVDAELLERLGHLNLLDGVQLAAWYLLAVAKCCVEDEKSVVHFLKILLPLR